MTEPLLLGLIYLMFFLSGAAALVYQVVWVRSLTLVFGGSHLAVTAVLSIFMAGLAIGGYVIGRRVDRVARPLRLYGLLEIGIAASALAFVGLLQVYPSIYVVLARGRDEATLYLTGVRMLFSIVALIVPTVLMGGTLPVLSRFVSGQPEHLRGRLAFLYGLNTLGAVLGALMAGFVLLPAYGVRTTLYVAIALNTLVGLAALRLPERAAGVTRDEGERPAMATSAPAPTGGPAAEAEARRDALAASLVLWGIGISGFCALGYEVLWTRVLTVAVGASVYGFTIMLVAFLTGIALGSKAYGALVTVFGAGDPGPRRPMAWFGLTQVAIGATALLVTVYLRDVPANAVRLQSLFLGADLPSFRARVWTSFCLAFLYMVVPALFMGAAFPLAGEALARRRRAVGRAVGDVLAANTVGAILGAALSGLLLIHVFGIERSLQILTVVNLGIGLVVLASLQRARWLPAGVAAAALAAITGLALNDEVARVWDRKYFAIFRSNQPEAFRTPEMVREAVENTDVLYYAEGAEAIVSVIKVKGGEPAFLTNGRVEASAHPQALQVQFALGHLPLLLARNPRDVLVVGLGSGMTAGATVAHPSVERVTIVEIEPQVLGVARTFASYNHGVLDDPRVRIVVNDGRNFLLTTARTFDVITADPIHPWFRGAGYLYSTEYFELAAAHLRPGGVVAQWLPIYELTPQDLACIVRTFREHFPHTLLFLTHYDAELLGSLEPFAIDEADLERRIAVPAVAGDLGKVMMGSATDLLSYFVMGTTGMARFAQAGALNTDDNLYLEFSAPFSIANPALMAENVRAIAAHRESLLPYLKPAPDAAGREAQRERWTYQLAAAKVGDPALALFLQGARTDPAFRQLLGRLRRDFPWYAPGRFLQAEDRAAALMEPRLLGQLSLALANDDGGTATMEVSSVLVPVSRTRASIMFVDNRARVVFGQMYVDDYERDGVAHRLAGDVLGAVHATYEREVREAAGRGAPLPLAREVVPRIRSVIGSKVEGVRRAP